MVSDAKYKGWSDAARSWPASRRAGVDPSDFYQVVSACLAFGTSAGLIVCPRVEELPPGVPGVENWRLDSRILEAPLRIGVVRLDCRSVDQGGWVSALEEQLRAAIGEMVSTSSASSA